MLRITYILIVAQLLIVIQAAAQFGPERLIVETELDDPIEVISWDLDSDGDVDLVCLSKQDKKISWYENLGDESFSSMQEIYRVLPGDTILFSADEGSFFHLVDFNMDERTDLYLSGRVYMQTYGSPVVLWLEHREDHTFLPHIIQLTENPDLDDIIKYSLPEDIDLDGDIDIVLAMTESQTIRYLENDGNGNFGFLQTLISDVYIRDRFFLSDLDTNGWEDIVLVDDDEILWYPRMDSIDFGPPSTLLSMSNRFDWRIHLHDMNMDGLDDILFRETAAELKIVLNKGHAIFEERITIISSYGFGKDVLVFDVDEDGDQDILNSSLHGFSLYENIDILTYSGHHTDYTSSPGNSLYYSIDTLDYDRNGILDVALTRRYHNLLGIYPGLGSFTFGALQL